MTSCKGLVTFTAPVNIAVIKYWGKRDERLILPINSSISLTLDQADMCTRTSVAAVKVEGFDADNPGDRLWLNGREEQLTNRMKLLLAEARRRAQSSFARCRLHICSENNFPTAAGLASSAAGLACLAVAVSSLLSCEGDLSSLARLGSGSACRSVYGGFVMWHKGSDPYTSVAQQLASHTHWPEIRCLILVVSDRKKATSSTSGMQTSVQTSELLAYRAEALVERKCDEMKTSIEDRDFGSFARITMAESNQFHAVCLDTYPPISYLRDTSHAIIHLVHKLNDQWTQPKIAYTFDAGPNACLYVLDEALPELLAAVNHVFAPGGELEIRGSYDMGSVPEVARSVQARPGELQYGIVTRVGPGPQQQSVEDSLLDSEGLPKSLHA